MIALGTRESLAADDAKRADINSISVRRLLREAGSDGVVRLSVIAQVIDRRFCGTCHNPKVKLSSGIVLEIPQFGSLSFYGVSLY